MVNTVNINVRILNVGEFVLSIVLCVLNRTNMVYNYVGLETDVLVGNGSLRDMVKDC